MEHRVHVNWLGAAIVVALGFTVSVVTSAVVGSSAFESRIEQIDRADREMSVTGYARKRVRSDTAVWEIQIQGGGPTLASAYEELDAAENRVRAFLSDHGFPDAEVSLSAIGTTTHHERDEKGRQTHEIQAYTLERTVTVTTRDVERVASVAGDVTQLLRDNVRVVSGRPRFTITDIGALKVEVIGAASADARTRAEEMAGEAGCAVTDVRGARTGVMQITKPDSTDVSSYGIYDTSTIEKDIAIAVTLTFGIAG